VYVLLFIGLLGVAYWFFRKKTIKAVKNNIYSPPVTKMVKNNTYSPPVIKAVKNNTYSPPVIKVVSNNTYSPPAIKVVNNNTYFSVKKVIYWLMGEKAGRILVGTWNWLWGIPVESGGQVSVNVAEESLRSMQEALHKLATAVATQVAAYERAKQKYDQKEAEMRKLEQQAAIAQRNGNEDAARLAMTKVIQIEQILPQLKIQVDQAEQYVKAAKDKLNRERLKLEEYKTQLSNMKDMSEINKALAEIAKVNNDLSIDSARSQFEQAKSAVERKNLQQNALAELSENPNERLQADLEGMVIDDEVSRRLKSLQSDNQS
ncbi:MAG: PspA/IM30 family protein, partial [Microcoleaceae cyanobacterium]